LDVWLSLGTRAYQVLFLGPEGSTVPVLLKFLSVAMMFVNGVLGPYLAYPALLKKGLPVLGLAQPSVGKEVLDMSNKSSQDERRTQAKHKVMLAFLFLNSL
jgi:hypothetical protein